MNWKQNGCELEHLQMTILLAEIDAHWRRFYSVVCEISKTSLYFSVFTLAGLLVSIQMDFSLNFTGKCYEAYWKIHWNLPKTSLKLTEIYREIPWNLPRNSLNFTEKFNEIYRKINWNLPKNSHKFTELCLKFTETIFR